MDHIWKVFVTYLLLYRWGLAWSFLVMIIILFRFSLSDSIDLFVFVHAHFFLQPVHHLLRCVRSIAHLFYPFFNSFLIDAGLAHLLAKIVCFAGQRFVRGLKLQVVLSQFTVRLIEDLKFIFELRVSLLESDYPFVFCIKFRLKQSNFGLQVIVLV